MPIFARIARTVLVTATLLAAGALVYGVLAAKAAPRHADMREIARRAALYSPRIRRDTFGVPHILGRTDADVTFGLAYAHCEDDFATIQDVMMVSRGELAADKGASAAQIDYLVRWMRVWPDVEAHYAALPADVRRVLEAYADGINLYASQHPKQTVAHFLPVTGKDVVAGFVFKTPLFYGFPDRVGEVISAKAPLKASPIGSNGVAVAPSRSADGATRLLVNSHQPYTGAVAWYEAVLDSGEGLHVAGGFFPGSPFMLHGHNANLGWANTVNKPQLVDVYRLTINPNNKNQYLLDGAWRDFTIGDAALKVRLFGPVHVLVHKPLLWSEHGPVMRTPHGVYAFRYAGMGETRQALQYYRLDKAKTQAEWLDAMRLQALPSINYIYADQTGQIGYVYNGQYPVRKDGVDATKIEPGDRSDLIWRAYRPFSQTPQIWRPHSGYVFNSNNTPFAATGAEDALKPADYPASMGLERGMTNRALRAQETFGADSQISEASFRKYKFDVSYSRRSDMARLMRFIAALDPKGDLDLAAAKAVLAGWNLSADKENRSAALAILTFMPLEDALAKGEPVDPKPALRAAMSVLRKRYGRLDPAWGQVNRILRGTVDLPLDGGPDTFRAVYGDLQKDARLKAKAGDTFIMFVTWDRLGQLSSESIHQFGSATLDATSPHYADQTPLFADMKVKPVYFTEDQLRPHIKEDYTPQAPDR